MLECLTIQLSLKISRRITGVDRILSIGLMCRLSQAHSSVSSLFQLGTASSIFAIVEIEPRLLRVLSKGSTGELHLPPTISLLKGPVMLSGCL